MTGLSVEGDVEQCQDCAQADDNQDSVLSDDKQDSTSTDKHQDSVITNEVETTEPEGIMILWQ